jgi:hypothetical protein
MAPLKFFLISTILLFAMQTKVGAIRHEPLLEGFKSWWPWFHLHPIPPGSPFPCVPIAAPIAPPVGAPIAQIAPPVGAPIAQVASPIGAPTAEIVAPPMTSGSDD